MSTKSGFKFPNVCRSHSFVICVVLFFLIACFFCCLNFLLTSFVSDPVNLHEQSLDISTSTEKEVYVERKPLVFAKKSETCTFYDCFDLQKCILYSYFTQNTIKMVSIMKKKGETLDHQMTNFDWRHREILRIILSGNDEQEYSSVGLSSSCISVPSLDFIDLNTYNSVASNGDFISSVSLLSSMLETEMDNNFLVVNMIPSSNLGYFDTTSPPFLHTMVASSALLTNRFRTGFDVPIPYIHRSINVQPLLNTQDKQQSRGTFLLVTASSFLKVGMKTLDYFGTYTLQILDVCNQRLNVDAIEKRCRLEKSELTHESEVVIVDIGVEMAKSQFCLLSHNSWYRQSDLTFSLLSQCIPVITSDVFMLPFDSIIDWKSVAVVNYNSTATISQLIEHLSQIDADKIIRMRNKGKEVYEKYFKSMEKVFLTTINIIHSRINPLLNHQFKPDLGFEETNSDVISMIPHTLKNKIETSIPLMRLNRVLSPFISSNNSPNRNKFTAVILTHDYSRIQCMFQLIQVLMEVPELDKVLIVWNNQVKFSAPAQDVQWPQLPKPLKIINMLSNKLTNRFVPFKDINTEAVLSLDDDMTNLCWQVISKAFRVWQSNPNRLIGFTNFSYFIQQTISSNQVPTYSSLYGGANHDNSEFDRSDRERVSRTFISTGGAVFYHQSFANLFSYYSHIDAFTWIEEMFSCEDVAFSLFVSNLTKLHPLTVAVFPDCGAANRTDSSNCNPHSFPSRNFNGMVTASEKEDKDIEIRNKKQSCLNHLSQFYDAHNLYRTPVVNFHFDSFS